MTAFSRQILRRKLHAVEDIGNMRGDRQGLVCAAAVADITAARVPDEAAVGSFRIGLITVDVLNVLQVGAVGDRLGAVGIFQPCADDGFRGRTVGLGDDVDGFLLAGGIGMSAQKRIRGFGDLRLFLGRRRGVDRTARQATQEHQCAHAKGNLLSAFHDEQPPVRFFV